MIEDALQRARAALLTLGATLALAGCFLFDSSELPSPAEGAGGAGPLDPGCHHDPDCDGDERCLLGPPPGCDPQSCTAPGHCGASPGVTPDLLPCEVDLDCASGSCSPEQRCRRLCEQDFECPPAFGCEPFVPSSGVPASACLPLDTWPTDLRRCGLRDGPGCPDGERCVLLYEEQRTPDWIGVCLPDDESLAPDLTPCTEDRHDTCRGGLCAEDACVKNEGCPEELHVCTSSCTRDEDCTFPTRCLHKDGAAAEGPFGCEVDCLDDRSCAAGLVCGLSPDVAAPYATCLSTAGLRATGEPCEQPDECGSRLCVAGDAAGGMVCSQLCNPADEDSCTANGLPTFTCAVVRTADPARRSIHACVSP